MVWLHLNTSVILAQNLCTMYSYDIQIRKVVNFCNKVNELFPLLSRLNKMADLLLIVDVDLLSNILSYHSTGLLLYHTHSFIHGTNISPISSMVKSHDFIFTKLTRLLLEVPTRH